MFSANQIVLQVKLRTFPKMNVYVLSYGGWMTSLNKRSNAKALSSALDAAGAKYIKGKFYAAGYNRSIMHYFKKHQKRVLVCKSFHAFCLLQSNDAVQQTQWGVVCCRGRPSVWQQCQQQQQRGNRRHSCLLNTAGSAVVCSQCACLIHICHIYRHICKNVGHFSAYGIWEESLFTRVQLIKLYLSVFCVVPY